MPNNKHTVAQLAPMLTDAIVSILRQFKTDHPSDTMYAFALVASAEGTHICCAIATEQTLDAVAQKYAKSGYQAKSGDTIALLRQELRWANPDDGWYYYMFDNNAPILNELAKAFDSNAIEMFDGTTEATCIQALQQLDQDGAFGIGDTRERITVGFTDGEDPEVFVQTAAQLNPTTTFERTRKELTESYSVAEQLSFKPNRQAI